MTIHQPLSWFFPQQGEVPTMSGYTPAHHCTCMNLMILKKSHIFELSTQRTLGVLDTELYNNNKFIAKQTKVNALSLNTIAI